VDSISRPLTPHEKTIELSTYLGLILRNSFSVENYLDKFYSTNFEESFTQKNHKYKIYLHNLNSTKVQLPDFFFNIPNGKNIPNTKLLQNIPNCSKIYQHLPWQDPPKFTQIGIFGLKIYNLATLYIVTHLRTPPSEWAPDCRRLWRQPRWCRCKSVQNVILDITFYSYHPRYLEAPTELIPTLSRHENLCRHQLGCKKLASGAKTTVPTHLIDS
jgi:hypothetical protein